MLTSDSKKRKEIPMARGCLDYFPDALAAVAELSEAGNRKHNPGQPLHWSKEKSTDHADCIMRHLADRGTIDTEDGIRHSAKVAWRALALLQIEIEYSQPCEMTIGVISGMKFIQKEQIERRRKERRDLSRSEPWKMQRRGERRGAPPKGWTDRKPVPRFEPVHDYDPRN